MSGILCLSRMTLSQALSKALFHFQADLSSTKDFGRMEAKILCLVVHNSSCYTWAISLLMPGIGPRVLSPTGGLV